MSELTLEERLSFYKELLRLVCRDPNVSAGYCYYMSHKMKFWYRRHSTIDCIYAYQFKQYFPELYAYKPVNLIREYWFPCTAEGWQHRINILVKIIHKLENDLNYETS